jgi:hypothetical protein
MVLVTWDQCSLIEMRNCNPFIFLRQDCQLPGVRFDFYAISNRGAPDSSRENANRSLAAVGGTVSAPIDLKVCRAYGWRNLTVWRVCPTFHLIVEV